ncbi:MAG: homocysteine S-methyltransferase family protein [Verrucomicrobia bacterium]|nr:homocysteine S-methyltransferase family protein [Verrucomicrobiota bacterium]
MHPLLEQLINELPVLLDGAWGTELQAHGLQSGECPDEWNLSHPDQVEAVARRYLNAGSRIILTNTFGANPIRLGEFGLADKALEINHQGVLISKAAAADNALVFASIGPTGKLLMMGNVNEADLADAYSKQAETMVEAGADAIVVETMSDLTEATIAVTSAHATGLPVVACMVYDSGKDKDRTMMGVSPEQATDELRNAGADIVGANCGLGIENYIPVSNRLHKASGNPVWIKPNAGMPEIVDGQVIYGTTPELFSSHLPDLVKAGAGFIGGCCGTSPEFIKAMKKKLTETK